MQVIALAGNGNWDSVKVNKFVHNTADQATVIDNVFNMSVATRTELTKWTANLLNQIRRAMGTTPLVVNEGSVAYAQAVAAQYDADGFNNYAEPGHDTHALYQIGDQFNTFWEEDESINIVWNQMARNNLPGWQTVKTSVTLDAIKENIYKGLVGMLFNDLDSNWGHSESLTGLINAKLITGDHQQALGVSVGHDGWLHFNLGTTTVYGKTNVLGQKLLDLTVTGHATAAQLAALQAAQANLATTKANYQTAQTKLTQATAQVKATQVQAVQQALRTALANLSQAQAKVKVAQAAVKTAQAQLAQAKAAVQAAQAKVDQLLAGHATQAAALQAAQATLAQAQSNLATKQAAQAKAQTKLAALKASLTSQQGAPVDLTVAQADLAVAEQKLATATAQLQLLKAAVDAKAAVVDQAQAAAEAATAKLAKAQTKLMNVKAQVEEPAVQPIVITVAPGKTALLMLKAVAEQPASALPATLPAVAPVAKTVAPVVTPVAPVVIPMTTAAAQAIVEAAVAPVAAISQVQPAVSHVATAVQDTVAPVVQAATANVKAKVSEVAATPATAQQTHANTQVGLLASLGLMLTTALAGAGLAFKRH